MSVRTTEKVHLDWRVKARNTTASNGLVVTLGELMLRLKPFGNERLLQSPLLEAAFGGSESNVAISLANFGVASRFVTALPQNALGDAALAYLASFHVDVSQVRRQGGRLGIYFVEAGSDMRPSSVVYDRAGSAMASAAPADFDWDEVFRGAGWLHLSGITPAISQNAADTARAALQAANHRGLTVSFDLNYRRRLWNYGKKPTEVLPELLPLVDVLIANEEDIQCSLGIELRQRARRSGVSLAAYGDLIRRVRAAFPRLQAVAITLRESHSATHNEWSAVASVASHKRLLVSPKYSLRNIIDRLGAGDAFAGGLIYGMCRALAPQEALGFAVAASALKHTIPGDANRVTVQEVGQLADGNRMGRVVR
jgi:2-dehydro-3-deoxygluconokinase